MRTMTTLGTALTMALTLALPPVLTSCTDDEEDTSTPPAASADAIGGTYDGYTYAYIAYSTAPIFFQGEQLVITPTGEGKADLTLVSQRWNCSAAGATVTLSEGVYTIEGEASASIEAHLTDNVMTYQGRVTATVNEDGSSCQCAFELPGLMGGVTVNFVKATPEEQELAQEEMEGISVTGPTTITTETEGEE